MAGVKGRSGGANRKTVAEHKLFGTYRPRRHRAWVDPTSAAAAPEAVVKPSWLSAVGGAVWDRLAPVASGMGTLTAADATAFAVLCELQSTLEFASSQKGASATAIKLERDTAAALRPFYALFGLEPVSRARLHVTPPAADEFAEFDNPLDKFLSRTKRPVLP